MKKCPCRFFFHEQGNTFLNVHGVGVGVGGFIFHTILSREILMFFTCEEHHLHSSDWLELICVRNFTIIMAFV